MFLNKFQGHRPCDSWEEFNFEGVYHILMWRLSWSCDQVTSNKHLSSMDPPHLNLISQASFEQRMFENEKRGNKQCLLDTPRSIKVIGMCLQVLMKFHQLLFKIIKETVYTKAIKNSDNSIGP